MKRIALLATLLAVLFTAGACLADTLEKAKAGGAVSVGLLRDQPPFSFIDRSTGRFSGYDAEFVTLIAEKLGLKVAAYGYDAALGTTALAEGKIHLLAASLTVPAKGESPIDFSDTYLTTGQRLLARKGKFASVSDIVGKKIGVVVNTPSETCARNNCPAAQIIPFADYDKALTALDRGEIDAFSSDQAILLDILAMLPGQLWEIPQVAISSENYVLGLPRGDAAFRDSVNKAIADIKADGSAENLKNKWFSTSAPRPRTAWGAVVRKAVTGLRVLCVDLEGFMTVGAAVEVFTPDGNIVARGKVVSVLGDEFYIDVDEDAFPLMRAGFLVTMNVERSLSKSIALENGMVLQKVKENSDKEAADIRAQADKDAEARSAADAELRRSQKEAGNQLILERERYRSIRRLYDNVIFRNR